MERDIVVGLDASQASALALGRAVAEARSTGRIVQALHVWSTPVWSGPPGFGYGVLPDTGDLRGAAEALLGDQLAAFSATHDLGSVVLKPSVLEGDPKRALVEAAQDAGLLVVGRHGAGLLRSLLMGSVSSYALHHAPCPVMVVPETAAPSEVRRVVVGADGSAASRAAMRWALDAARRHDCPLLVVHAWLMPTLPASLPMPSPPSFAEMLAGAKDWLRVELEVLPDREGVTLDSEAVHGRASWALMSNTAPGDLLVVGSRGHGGFGELLLGSTAAQCAQHAQGTTVVVHPDDERLAR